MKPEEVDRVLVFMAESPLRGNRPTEVGEAVWRRALTNMSPETAVATAEALTVEATFFPTPAEFLERSRQIAVRLNHARAERSGLMEPPLTPLDKAESARRLAELRATLPNLIKRAP